MTLSIPCRDCPTTKVPKSQLPATCPACHGFGMGRTCRECQGTGVMDAFSEADLLAADLRSCALRLERLGTLTTGGECPAAVSTILEIAEAVELAAVRPVAETPESERPF